MKKYMKKHIIADSINHIARMKLFLLGTLFLFVACNGQKKATMQQDTAATNTGLELLVSDEHSGAEVSETIVIKDAKALKTFFSKINRTRKPGLPVPDVNFEKDMIVITCSGERNDGAMPTLMVKEETTSQMVLTTVLQPDKKNTSQAITSPFSIYKMPLTEKEIIFEKAKQ